MDEKIQAKKNILKQKGKTEVQQDYNSYQQNKGMQVHQSSPS